MQQVAFRIPGHFDAIANLPDLGPKWFRRIEWLEPFRISPEVADDPIQLTLAPDVCSTYSDDHNPVMAAVQRALDKRSGLIVHAAAFTLDDRVVLLVGLGGAGKTTSLLWLAQNVEAFAAASDDLSVVDGAGTVVGIPKNVAVYPYHQQFLPQGVGSSVGRMAPITAIARELAQFKPTRRAMSYVKHRLATSRVSAFLEVARINASYLSLPFAEVFPAKRRAPQLESPIGAIVVIERGDGSHAQHDAISAESMAQVIQDVNRAELPLPDCGGTAEREKAALAFCRCAQTCKRLVVPKATTPGEVCAELMRAIRGL